jgi:uncharacterized protein (TIGR03663 family)
MENVEAGKIASRVSTMVFIAALIIGVWVRFERIELKPLHHDEGVNAFFLLNLARQGNYRYNPDNYHGPTLYYFALLPIYLLGERDLALRVVPAIFGVLTIGMVWLLRRRLGRIGTPGAALLMAVSTGLVYYSRDFIHEMIFGCLSLGIVTGAVKYAENRKFRYFLMSLASTALLFATKETAMVTAGVLLLAVLAATVWDLVRRRTTFTAAGIEIRQLLSELRPSLDFTLAGLIIFVFIFVVFYSSMFNEWSGVTDAIKSPWGWTVRSRTEHLKGFWYYAGILLKLELPLLIGAVIGGVLIAWRGSRFWLFVGAWTFGIFLAYSLIGYKTPWLIVNLLIPMALLGGYAMERLFGKEIRLDSGHDRIFSLVRIAVLIATISGIALGGKITRHVNLVDFDDNRNLSGFFAETGKRLRLKPYLDDLSGYVYVQTDRDILNLVSLIENEAAASPERKNTAIFVCSPDYWPLPWYLRDYPAVTYSGNLPSFDAQGNPAIGQRLIIASAGQAGDFSGASGYRASPTSYVLRPGANLILLVRDPDAENEQLNHP